MYVHLKGLLGVSELFLYRLLYWGLPITRACVLLLPLPLLLLQRKLASQTWRGLSSTSRYNSNTSSSICCSSP